MKLTADMLVSALNACGGQGVDDRAEVVLAARAVQPAFAPTIYSAWRAEGDALNPGLQHDLDAAAARIDFYRSVAATLASRVPGLTPIKGLEVEALYPEGYVRAMNDLDYVATTERDVWAAVSVLTGDGWSIDTATFSRFEGRLQIMVSMRLAHPDPYQLPYGVEIATYYALGDLGGIGPLLTLPPGWRRPPIKNLLMLLYERFEQPYRARDLIDAVLMAAAFDDADVPVVHRAIEHLGLSAEYTELARLVGGCGLGPLPEPRSRPWAPHVTRVRRMARSVGFFGRPVLGAARHLQRRNVSGTSGEAERKLSEVVWPMVSVTEAVDGGMLAFGLPLDGGTPDVEVAEIHTRGTMTWVDTPVARFLLTVGDDVTESAVDALTIPAGATAIDPDEETAAPSGEGVAA
jgi:hypothetical protein